MSSEKLKLKEPHHGSALGHLLRHVRNHNNDVGKVVVIDSFVGINAKEFKELIKIVNYFIFM
jgi:hypothetical protein